MKRMAITRATALRFIRAFSPFSQLLYLGRLPEV